MMQTQRTRELHADFATETHHPSTSVHQKMPEKQESWEREGGGPGGGVGGERVEGGECREWREREREREEEEEHQRLHPTEYVTRINVDIHPDIILTLAGFGELSFPSSNPCPVHFVSLLNTQLWDGRRRPRSVGRHCTSGWLTPDVTGAAGREKRVDRSGHDVCIRCSVSTHLGDMAMHRPCSTPDFVHGF